MAYETGEEFTKSVLKRWEDIPIRACARSCSPRSNTCMASSAR